MRWAASAAHDGMKRETESGRQLLRADERYVAGEAREMPCPVCGQPMSDLRGGTSTICPVCGFKDSCCY